MKVHQNIKTDPELLFEIISPFLDDIVIGVKCVFCWYWISDLCAEHKIPFVLGYALYMKAIRKGKSKNACPPSGELGADELCADTHDCTGKSEKLMRANQKRIAYLTGGYHFGCLKKCIQPKAGTNGLHIKTSNTKTDFIFL